MSSPLHVLILEDNPADAELVVNELRQSGYEPAWTCVENELEYRDCLAGSPDIILSDFCMPRFDALQALCILKKSGKDIPFIIVSGSVGEETAVLAMQEGAADYIPKRHLARLGQSVSRAVEQKRLRFEKRRAEESLREQARLAEMSAEVGIALTSKNDLRDMLRPCVESIVRNLHAAFAGIWTLSPSENVLELQASAGAHTHIEDAHDRIPVGQYMIGLLAEERRPYLTNDVQNDPCVHDKEWAKRQGLVSFVGYPLLIDDKLVGVMAMFAERPLTDFAWIAMATIADGIALGIERKLAEAAVQKAHQETESLLAAIPSILIGVDEGDRIYRWNAVAEKTFGISAKEAAGRRFLGCGIQWDWLIVLQSIAKCFEQGQPVKMDDLKFTRSDQKEGLLQLTLNPVRGDAGELKGYLILGGDITEHKLLESQLIQAQKLESIGLLAAGIAHEINTPAQFVNDNTHFLRDGFDDLIKVLNEFRNLLAADRRGIASSDQLSRIEAAMKEADLDYLVQEIPKAITQSLEGLERIAKIVKAMKEFAHPGSDERTAIDINKAIESTITVARNEWKYVADMETDLDPSLPLVPCLPGELNQVFLNIIVNAAHAIADVVGDGGKGKGTIKVATRKKPSGIEIRIGDTGTGIPEHVRDKIFTPFFTTKKVGKGTGQGLAISHDVIVKKHGGAIAFETEVGKGTAFIINLPVVCDPEQE